MYSKNQFLDVLEEESDEEEEQEKKENIEDDKNVKEEIDYDGNDIIPDDEIDELFRKSCADLQKMKDEIKFMNESIGYVECLDIVLLPSMENPHYGMSSPLS